MTPWANEFADWGAEQNTAETDEDDAQALEETKGCAIIDSGATVMCSSTLAAGGIQMQRIQEMN